MPKKKRHGGRREGSGRPPGSGKFGEPTIPLRIPKSLYKYVVQAIQGNGFKIPLYSSRVQAGFPSPADDYIEAKLDLNEYLIKNPASTFLVKATGDSMIGAGIQEGSILVVDRSIEAKDGCIVIAAINGELTVKRLKKRGKECSLMPENPKYKPIKITEEMDGTIWGVVTTTIYDVRSH